MYKCTYVCYIYIRVYIYVHMYKCACLRECGYLVLGCGDLILPILVRRQLLARFHRLHDLVHIPVHLVYGLRFRLHELVDISNASFCRRLRFVVK